jgi:hypothetical protein
MKPYRQSRRRANLCASSQPQHVRTSGRPSASSLLLLALFLALAATASASSTWYVDGVNGSDNNNCKTPQTACKTVRHGISLASSGDSIMVAAATYTENLTIAFSLKLIGSSAKTTIIDGGHNTSVVMISSSNSRVTLSKLTIQNGCCIDGGGILNNGTLTINNCNVTHNTTHNLGFGGGIFNTGTVTINNSTISGNTAAGGGGICSRGKLTINRSTLNGNTGPVGGGVFAQFGSPLVITNSTISGNIADVGGGIADGTTVISNSTISGNVADENSDGGGIADSTATLQNSIVANNKGGNCYNSGISSKGYNLSSDGTCNFKSTGDLNNADPKLGQLGNYGGPTQTIPLLSGSPAIDAGNPSGCTDGQGHLLKTDQRGKPRPDKEDTAGCDMGAYERQKD